MSHKSYIVVIRKVYNKSIQGEVLHNKKKTMKIAIKTFSIIVANPCCPRFFGKIMLWVAQPGAYNIRKTYAVTVTEAQFPTFFQALFFS